MSALVWNRPMRTGGPPEWKPQNALRLRDDFPGALAPALRGSPEAPAMSWKMAETTWRATPGAHRKRARGSAGWIGRAARWLAVVLFRSVPPLSPGSCAD